MLSIDSQTSIDRHEAVKALEHCAELILNDNLPHDVNHERLVHIFKAAAGKSPGSFRVNTTIPVRANHPEAAAHRVSLVRGVELNLDTQMKLISMKITPRKVREYREIMKIAGIGRDLASDVSVRHDDYLAEQSPHGAS